MKERVSSVLRKGMAKEKTRVWRKWRRRRGGGCRGRKTKGILGYVSECQPDSFCYYTLLPEAAKSAPTHSPQTDRQTDTNAHSQRINSIV